MRISDWSSDVCSSDLMRVMPTLRPTIAIVMSVISLAQRDLDFDARRQVESGQCVDGFFRRIDDLHEPLVRADFVLVTTVFVDVRRSKKGVTFLARGQRNRPAHEGTGRLRGLDNLLRWIINRTMVKC